MENSRSSNGLLTASDPRPVRKSGELLAECPFLLVGDHAGRAIPYSLNNLGLAQADRERHIALDIGVEELGQALSERLGAPFLRQAYSRLVIDCNRDPSHAEAIAATSDGMLIPGNAVLDDAARRDRVAEVHEPYQRAIGAAIDAREAVGLETILVSLHSFTPVMGGIKRPWHIGVLHDRRRDDFALCVLARLRRQDRFVVADNKPYAMDDTDYTVPRHAYPRDLRYLELEVRQDLLDVGASPLLSAIAHLLSQVLEDCA